MKPLLLPLFFAVAWTAAAAAKPNVLLICVDDLKPVLGCYGDATAKSPNIDRLAARGVLFESAYCNQAVCSPSRNTLMTSLRPQTLGIYDLGTHFRFAAPEAVTLTQHFMQNGYSAEGMGKILHVGHGNIDDAASWSVPSWKSKAPTYVLPESTSSTRPSKSGGPRGAATESADVGDDAYGDGNTAEEAIRRLQAAAQHPEQPFFIAVGFIRPHLPFVAPGISGNRVGCAVFGHGSSLSLRGAPQKQGDRGRKGIPCALIKVRGWFCRVRFVRHG